MATRALSLELDELRVLKTPCILHWDFSHFVVLVSVKRNRYVLHDPAGGHKIYQPGGNEPIFYRRCT